MGVSYTKRASKDLGIPLVWEEGSGSFLAGSGIEWR